MATASITPSAKRLASEGVVAAIRINIRQGKIDTTIPKLLGEEHRAYYFMLASIVGVATAIGQHSQYFESEACGVLQFYSEQIHRALSWTIDGSRFLSWKRSSKSSASTR